MAHLGRRARAAQQTALEWLYPTCAVEGCTTTAFLENDHRVDWADSHLTVFDLLDRLCSFHHDRKTLDGWALVEGRGKRAFVAPDDPRDPRQRPERQATTRPRRRDRRQLEGSGAARESTPPTGGSRPASVAMMANRRVAFRRLGGAWTSGVRIKRIAAELRLRRRRLDTYRTSPPWPGKEPTWRYEQAHYDRYLITAAKMLDLPVPEWEPGRVLAPEVRAVLEDRLAHAGLDVMAPPRQSTGDSSGTATCSPDWIVARPGGRRQWPDGDGYG